MTAPDFLALEAPLIARLREHLPGSVHVLGRHDLGAITEGAQPTPAVHVLYRGYRPRQSDTAMIEEFDLLWLTVVAVRNAATLDSGAAARADAGPLMSAVIEVLGPWVPPLPGYQSMHLADAPDVGYQAGFGYFPLGWRVAVRQRVAPNKRRST